MNNWEWIDRLDLSSWLIHFVHGRLLGARPYVDEDENGKLPERVFLDEKDIPSYFDEYGKGVFLDTPYVDDDWKLADNATPFDVLKKIVHEGFILSTWAFRKGNPSIYGPYSAVCFTEMPLYALVDYARKRGANRGYVGSYGIAVRRSEAFQAGARNVIYGLSNGHKEADYNSLDLVRGFRLLDESCGIDIEEQYRYVYTQLNGEKIVDWTFEREWRLPIKDDRWGSLTGLPILLDKELYQTPFSEVVIIVNSEYEKEEILNQLVKMHNSGSTESGCQYDLDLIEKTRVMSVEQIENSTNQTPIRLESIRVSEKDTLKIPHVTEEIIHEVTDVINSTQEVFDKAYSDFMDNNLGFEAYSYPISHVKVCTNDNTEYTQAMVESGLANAYGENRYYLELPCYFTGNEYMGKEVMNAVAKYLTQKFNQRFYVHIIPD